MKKRIVVCILCLFLVCGCEINDNKQEDYSNYEHYNLSNKKINFHTDENGNYYAIADITEEEQDEGGVNGIFYKINNKDYILLDKIECCGYANSYNDDSYTLFYKDKLYIMRCSGLAFYEYVFSGEEFVKVDLLSKINSDFALSSIEKVDDDFIYLKGRNDYSNSEYKSIKCSLDNYNCEVYE